jgi:RecA-family ATPase
MALLQREAISAMTYPQWVMDGIIPAGGISMIYGPSGKCKSFWVLDMAACVATGHLWNKGKVRQGPIIYVAGEGQSGYKARLEAWEKQHNTKASDFCLYDEPVRLWHNPDSLSRFIDEVRGATIKPAWIIFDTLSTCLGGANENDNGHMRELLDSAEDIRRALGNPAVTLVHHTGKTGNSPRGAQALADGVAMHAYLSGDGKAYGVLECTKQKDGEPFQLIIPISA